MNEFCNEWQQIMIGDGPFVKTAVVLYWSEFSILFSNKEEFTGIRRVGVMYTIESKVGFEKFFLFFSFFR